MATPLSCRPVQLPGSSVSTGVAGFLSAALTALLSEFTRQWLTASANRARARHSGGTTIYRLTLAGRLIIDAAILLMAGLAALVLYHGEDWRIALLLGGFVALCVFAYPGDVIVEASTGVRTRRWYGAAVKIAWRDVADLKGSDQLGQVTLVSVSGRRIVHTSLHADGPGFRREIQRHARLTPRIVPQ